MGKISDDIEKQLKDLSPKEAAKVRKILSGLLVSIDQTNQPKEPMLSRMFGRKAVAPTVKPRKQVRTGTDIPSVGAVVHSRATGLAPFYRRTLLKDVLPFWFPRCVDTENGGFLHCLDRDGTIVDTDKSVWAQGRMTWMLLSIYNNMEKKPEWLQWADSGLTFLEKHCFDDDGRMFFHMTRDGRPVRKRRYAFSECFASMAYAAHAQATNDDRSAECARELLKRFISWNFEPGNMPPKFTDTRPMTGIGPRMMALSMGN